MPGAAAVALALVVTAAGAVGGCSRRSAESKAAERAQDACIGALQPLADGKAPSAGVLDEAVGDAEAAASVDDRWGPLVVRLRAAVATGGGPDLGPAMAALYAECGRVNDIVRRGGKEPASA